MVSTRTGGLRKERPMDPEEYEDAIERHNRSHNERLNLNIEEDFLSEESEDDDPVLELDSEEGSDEESGGTADEKNDESELDSEEEIEKGTKYGKLLQQARAIKARLDISRGEIDESDDSEDDPNTNVKKSWGSRKGAYYDADIIDMEGSDDEEELLEEEEEAKRLQKEAIARMSTEDFGTRSGDSDDDEHAMEDTMQQILKVHGAGDEDAEDLRAAAVRQDALELKALVQELRASLTEIRGRIGPIIQEVKSGDIATSDGISYLEAKHVLLLHYVASLMFYLLMKAEGRQVKDHPVISRLVEIRSFLEKIRPIDKRLKYQIEKLLAAADAGRVVGDKVLQADGEGLSYKPRPDALVMEEKSQERELQGSGSYRPPKMNPISMNLDESDDSGVTRLSTKEQRRRIHLSRRAARSSFVQEFAAELDGAPQVKKMGLPIGMDTAEALRDRQRRAAREDVEEELMIRVPFTKEERKRMKAQRRTGLSGKALLDDFQDDIRDLVSGELAGIDSQFIKHRTNQRFGADLSFQQKRAMSNSGDADLPERDSLSSRRAKLDSARARKAISYDLADVIESKGEENEFYKASQRAIEERKKKRKKDHSPEHVLPPLGDPTVSGAREIDRAIEKNRGLTPHRRKDLKNPRKKHRIKFAEANIRRKGQVQTVKSGAAGGYGGESTGIKSKVSKSVRF